MKQRHTNVASLVKKQRSKWRLTQEDVTKRLGYKKAQMISNIENGKQSIPAKHLKQFCLVLAMDVEMAVDAKLKDYDEYLRRCLK
jgi:transcriptional regulator with XRE-family HTH domain